MSLHTYTLLLFFIGLTVAEVTNLLDRSNELKYDIVLITKSSELERLSSEKLDGLKVPFISPQTKKKFDCYLPVEQPSEEDQLDKPKQVPKIKDLLEPLTSACLYRLAGWWTYEFCYKKHVRQYHQEKDQPIRPQDDYYLGRAPFSNPLDIDSEDEDISEKPYYSEIYSNGTPCDITGSARSTEIRYYCSGDKSTTMITDIKEPASCSYIIQISTPLICKHPSYAPKKESIHPIYCIQQGVDQIASEELKNQEDDDDLDDIDEESSNAIKTAEKTINQKKKEIDTSTNQDQQEYKFVFRYDPEGEQPNLADILNKLAHGDVEQIEQQFAQQLQQKRAEASKAKLEDDAESVQQQDVGKSSSKFSTNVKGDEEESSKKRKPSAA